MFHLSILLLSVPEVCRSSQGSCWPELFSKGPTAWRWCHPRRWTLSTTSSLPLGSCMSILWKAVRRSHWAPGTATLSSGSSSSPSHSSNIASYTRPWLGKWWQYGACGEVLRGAVTSCHCLLLCSWKRSVKLSGLHRHRTFLGKHLLLAVPHFGVGLLHISR